jgi:hypothetical protein
MLDIKEGSGPGRAKQQGRQGARKMPRIPGRLRLYHKFKIKIKTGKNKYRTGKTLALMAQMAITATALLTIFAFLHTMIAFNVDRLLVHRHGHALLLHGLRLTHIGNRHHFNRRTHTLQWRHGDERNQH